MNRHDELLALERSAWEALSSSGDIAAAFYETVLAREVVMLLPGGLVIDDRATVIDSIRDAPWTSFELTDERVLDLGDAGAIVAYRGTAIRGDDEYRALFNSTYVREERRVEVGAAPTDTHLIPWRRDRRWRPMDGRRPSPFSFRPTSST